MSLAGYVDFEGIVGKAAGLSIRVDFPSLRVKAFDVVRPDPYVRIPVDHDNFAIVACQSVADGVA